MRIPRRLAALFVVAFAAACQTTNGPAPAPTVSELGSDLHCVAGDHAFEDNQAGFGFCYPGTWKYDEHAQSSDNPPEFDLAFDITDVPCTFPSPTAADPSPHPSCEPQAGLFGYMIIATYERDPQRTLPNWIATTLDPKATLTPIAWGNSSEAYLMSGGRRVALTDHHVVVLDLHSGAGNLNLEKEMSSRLATWKFTY